MNDETPLTVTVKLDLVALLHVRDSIRRLRDSADLYDETTIWGHLQAELDRTAAIHREMVLEQLGLLTEPSQLDGG